MDNFANHLEGLHFLNDTVLVLGILVLCAVALYGGYRLIRKGSKQAVIVKEEIKK